MDFEEYRQKEKINWEKHRATVRVPEGKLAQPYRDRFTQLYINWNMQETNKQMIIATWVLAIASIILSGITLYLQFGLTH